MKREITSITLVGLVLFGISPSSARAGGVTAGTDAVAPAAVRGDRWLEIDLYWFDRDNIGKSAEESGGDSIRCFPGSRDGGE
jgi:hypothetical protein